MWAFAWWFARRWMRRRAALAVANVTGGVAARRGRIGAVLGALGLVAALAAAFVVWRKLGSRADVGDQPSPVGTLPPEPTPAPTTAPPKPAAA